MDRMKFFLSVIATHADRFAIARLFLLETDQKDQPRRRTHSLQAVIL
jgi:hypothetical protein